jgi:hypothetical protein
MDINAATASYEKWIRKYIRVIDKDLELKHQHMAGDVFEFFRATYYRWAQVWPVACKPLARAPRVLGVGDLHVENFGTWRDAEGRLVWGINDFDEATELPYTNDLVRLAASAHLAINTARLAISRGDVCQAILAGYREGLEKGGRAFVLAEHHLDLRKLAVERLKDPGLFWKKLENTPTWKGRVSGKARKALDRAMPRRGLEGRFLHRIAGLGSLGRERLVVLATWDGGYVAREAKALAPSAALWAGNAGSSTRVFYQRILDTAVRSQDPCVALREGWIIRRLAPDCSRIELTDLPKGKDERYLASCMGFETANVHLGSGNGKKLLKHLESLGTKWLDEAAGEMVKEVERDQKKWASAHKPAKKKK